MCGMDSQVDRRAIGDALLGMGLVITLLFVPLAILGGEGGTAAIDALAALGLALALLNRHG